MERNILIIRIVIEEQTSCRLFLIFFHGSKLCTDLASKKPPHKPNAVRRFVVAWNGNVNKAERRVGVAEGNYRNVDIRCLSDRLVVESGVGDNE